MGHILYNQSLISLFRFAVSFPCFVLSKISTESRSICVNKVNAYSYHFKDIIALLQYMQNFIS